MKTILRSRRDRYLAKFSIFLITVALIAGIAGCTPERWNLTISSTPGGKVTSPREGTFKRGKGTMVSLVAKPDEGYRFVNWTGDVDTIADDNAAATNITMDGDYSITANFALEILEIWDWNDLYAIRNNLHSQHILMTNLNSTSANYTDLASPTANGEMGWEPIGTRIRPFTGSFDGQGYEIEDLFINRDDSYVGLFGYVDKGGVVKDIGVVNATVTGEGNVGGLVGWNLGTVSSSNYTGDVTGKDKVGGLAGWNGGTVSDSYSTGNVKGDKYVGGLVGYNHQESTVSVSDSYSTGNVTGDKYVGGLLGFSYKSIVRNSHYNYGEVLINGHNIITTGALSSEDFDQWLAKNKFLDFNGRLYQNEDGYYEVNNVTDFKELLAFGQDGSLKFRLEKDLDLGKEPNFYIPYFAGTFEGNGHNISNLSLNFTFAYNIGLFGFLAPSGMVTRVGVENVKITGASFVGGLVGASWEGHVIESYSTGSVSGEVYVGGLVGCNCEESTVSFSYSTGNVTGESHVGGLVGDNEWTVGSCNFTGNVIGDKYVGGLVGDNEYTVSNCHFTGNVTSEGSYIGGLVGQNQDTVNESSSNSSVTGYDYVGGLVGRNLGKVSESYSNSTVSGHEDVGGLLGKNEGTVEKSYSTGSVSGSKGSTHVGGLVGSNEGDLVSNCYSTSNVSGDSRVGGLVGQNKEGTVNSSYSTGRVSGEEDVGGLVGWNDATVSRSFWNIETSEQATSAGAGATGKNTTEMKSFNTFDKADWVIIEVSSGERPPDYYPWYILKGGVDYPLLSWQSI
jgi:hypothetical protein